MLCLFGLAATPAHTVAPCDDLLAAPAAQSGPVRLIVVDDLLKLRDIGQPDGAMFGQPSPLGISPDGSRAAFILSRADPGSNRYCRALVTINLSGAPRPQILDRGGEMITNVSIARGLVIDNGFPTLQTPVWSPDGRWIAYLRRDNGITQVWRARSDGGQAHAVTRSEVDIEALAWTRDGRRIVYAARPGRAEVQRRIDQEGRGGWLYDARVVPYIAARPRVSGAIPRTAFVVDPDSRQISSANAAEQSLVSMDDLSGSPIAPSALSPDGRRAGTTRSGASPLSPLQLFAIDGLGKRLVCTSPACDGGFTGLWWDEAGKELRFLRREGWAKGQMGLYRWQPGSAAPRRILLTDDVLLGCTPAGSSLLCTSENAVRPRHLVMIDLRNGHTRKVYDPNPEFDVIRLGTVERLRWRNDLGLEAWGDLVLPPGHRAGEKLPMVVVQYHSDGFLRGGTGDEYPIHAFAARGFAVLSIERPAFFAQAMPDIKSYDDVNAANGKNWAERRSLLSSLVTGVDMVIDRGLVDPERIGITGLSDGASTARFALINTEIFAAASISSCCIEPRTVMTYSGIAYAEAMRAMGYPSTDAPNFWQPYSMAQNAAAMDQPLLMQLADEEYLLGLETFTALRDAGQPVEMYIFPNEHHIKSQPAHRRAIYERNLDWFQFWLQSHIDPDPAKAAQYTRWKAMRTRLRDTPSPR